MRNRSRSNPMSHRIGSARPHRQTDPIRQVRTQLTDPIQDRINPALLTRNCLNSMMQRI